MTSRDERLNCTRALFHLSLSPLSLFCIFSSSSLQESFFRRGRATRFSSLFLFSRIAFENARVALRINARLIESEISCFFQWRIYPTRLFHAFLLGSVTTTTGGVNEIANYGAKTEKSKGIRRDIPFLCCRKVAKYIRTELLSQDSLTLPRSIRYGVSRLSSDSIRYLSDSICFSFAK